MRKKHKKYNPEKAVKRSRLLFTDKPIITELYKLFHSGRKNFSAIEKLPKSEVKFVYDIISNSKENPSFMMSDKQANWALSIITKIKKPGSKYY